MFPEPKFDTKISASLNLKPELSQISIIVILVISGLSFLTSFYFLWHGKPWWLPATAGTVCLLLSVIAWWRSQRAIDLGNSFPTEISDNNGLRVITDTRAIESKNAINNLAKIIETVSLRQPLPHADGIISEKGKVLENSEMEGREVTERINALLKTKARDFGKSYINIQKDSAQKVINPPIDENIVIHSGIAKDA